MEVSSTRPGDKNTVAEVSVQVMRQIRHNLELDCTSLIGEAGGFPVTRIFPIGEE